MIEIYDEKENFQTDPSIPKVNKVSDDDMNQLRNAVLKGVYYDNINQKLIDQNGQILNPDIPKYDNNEGTNYIQIGNLKICWGTVQVSYVNPNVMSSTLSFPVNFTNNPTVLATINGTNNASSELDENAKVSGIGTSSCLIYVHSKNGEFSSGWKQNVNWIAVGY